MAVEVARDDCSVVVAVVAGAVSRMKAECGGAGIASAAFDSYVGLFGGAVALQSGTRY
jgi:hypothetical protein